MKSGVNFPQLTLGILSGTSVDAIDIAMIEWHGEQRPILKAHAEYPWEKHLQQQLLTLPEKPFLSLQHFGELHTACGQAFAQAIRQFIHEYRIPSQEIAIIGSHGQTIWHAPQGKTPFSLQLGHPAILAKETGIRVAADFRMDDIAQGGQGAPLAPALHRLLFAQDKQMIAVLNLGGIANLSLLFPNGKTIGFDTGPANTLLDAWYRLHHPLCEKGFDEQGQWASSSQPDKTLVEHLLKHPFFQQTPPKSTGREDFSLLWLQEQLTQLGKGHLSPAVIQSSLLALTRETILPHLQALPKGQLWLCGGGVHNKSLVHSLIQALPRWKIATTDSADYASNALEAMLFAYLGYMRLKESPIDLSHITGQKKATILGGLWRE